jgi:hypothetical protein
LIFRCDFENGEIKNPHLIPIQIQKLRPVIADSLKSIEIFKHVSSISDTFKTVLTLKDNLIQIHKPDDKFIYETFCKNLKFDVYNKHFEVYDNRDYYTRYQLPDTHMIIRDVCSFYEDSTLYFYTIVKNKSNGIPGLAVFPYSFPGSGFLIPFMDQHFYFNPWNIELLDTDNDLNPEVVMATFHSSRYNDPEENRIIVFKRRKDHLTPFWYGACSKSHIFDFTVDNYDQDTNQRLVILEALKDTCIVRAVAHKWKNPGFIPDKILFEARDNKKIDLKSIGLNLISMD